MSMDFVYDLTEKLQEQKIDYLLVTVRKGKRNDTADVFYCLQDNDSVDAMVKAVDDSRYFIEQEKTDNANPPSIEQRRKDEARKRNRRKPDETRGKTSSKEDYKKGKKPKTPPRGKGPKRRGGEDGKK